MARFFIATSSSSRVDQDLAQEGIVNLDQKTGIDDGFTFLADRVGDRFEELLVRLVEIVCADACGGNRWNDGAFNVDGVQRRRERFEVAIQRYLTFLGNWPSAIDRVELGNSGAVHRSFHVVGVIFRKRFDLSGIQPVFFIRRASKPSMRSST